MPKFKINHGQVWDAYHTRQKWREKNNIPAVAIVGPGGCGKDTAGIWIHNNTPLTFAGSCSWVMAPYIAKELKQSVEEAYAQRRENRTLWRKWIDEVREKDPAIIAAMCLGISDVFCGSRPVIELEAARAKRMMRLTFWIENPNCPEDSTLEIKARDCDVSVINDGTLSTFYQKLRQLFVFQGFC